MTYLTIRTAQPDMQTWSVSFVDACFKKQLDSIKQDSKTVSFGNAFTGKAAIPQELLKSLLRGFLT
eukprot:1479978-Amphidinium_carterae.1